MCGFVGFTNDINDSNQVLQKMLDSIQHRGPDAEGTYIDEDIALGHRRLSIIDVTNAGNQPLYSEDGNLVLIYNGEIYNYKDIRKRLQKAGYHFATQTDSEVLIYGYREYGPELLQQLRGMFSFVIWDKSQKIVVWRTRFLRHQATLLCPDAGYIPVRLRNQKLLTSSPLQKSAEHNCTGKLSDISVFTLR